MCRYFEIGQCARGASCSYAHGEQDLRIGLTAAQQNAGGVKRSFSEAGNGPAENALGVGTVLIRAAINSQQPQGIQMMACH